MKFGKLEMCNFLAIEHAEINLADRGLLLIQGKNLDDPSADSNGAGKSSITDALCWVLKGVTARGVSGDAVINNITKKGTAVMVHIEDGADTYSIARTRKPNGLAVLKIDGTSSGTIDLTKGTEKETQEVIDAILGCSLDVFMAAIYAGQEAMPDLPGMTDKNLKLIIEEASGAEELAAGLALARENHQKANQALDNEIARNGRLVGEVASTKKSLDEYTLESTRWLGAWASDFATLKKEAEAAKDYADRLAVDLSKFDVPALQASLASVQTRIVLAFGDQRDKEQEYVEAIGRAEREMAARAMLANTKKVARDKLAATSLSESVCKSCGQSLATHDPAEHKRRHEEALALHNADLHEALLALKESKGVVDTLKESLRLHRESMDDPTALLAGQNEIQAQLLTAQTLKIKYDSAVLDAAHAQKRQAEKSVEKNPFEATVSNFSKRHRETVEALKESDALLPVLSDAEELAADVVNVFSPAGVRAHILDTVTPFLNARTAEYLGALSDGSITAVWSTLSTNAKGELKEKFNIEVVNSKGASTFAGNSGGEKRKVRLACFMALQDLVATRASKPIDLFIGDEIDHALDESGLERLMTLLEQKARDRGTVLVISHNSLADWCDNVITVVKDGGKSYIESAT